MSAREFALRQFDDMPFPTPRDEGWRHQHIGSIDYDFKSNEHTAPPQYDVEGHTRDTSVLKVQKLKSEARVSDYHSQSRFFWMNEAFWTERLLIEVPPNIISSTLLTITVHDTALLSLPRIKIIVGERSQLNIVIQSKGKSRSIRSSIIEVLARAGSNVGIAHHITSRSGMRLFDHIFLHGGAGSVINHTIVLSGSGIARAEINASMIEAEAAAQLQGLMIGRGEAQLVTHTVQNHQAPQTSSNLQYRSIGAGQSHLFYQGLIQVSKQAHGTNAYQKNVNLLLDTNARAYSSPKLEIKASDVRCTHAATSGPLDPELVFYLQSRGFSHSVAKSILMEGYGTAILARIPNNKLRRYVRRTILAEIKGLR